MSTVCTQVGIVEWARRAEGARAAEMWLAETLADQIPAASAPAVKIDLARRARLHGWHADLWRTVVPALPELDAGADDLVHPAPGAGLDAVLARLGDAYGRWRVEAGELAEAPILRVLGLIARDHEEAR